MSRNCLLLRVARFILIAGSLSAPGLAQVPTAEISGLVTDTSGAVRRASSGIS